jgi:hypothetical protein
MFARHKIRVCSAPATQRPSVRRVLVEADRRRLSTSPLKALGSQRPTCPRAYNFLARSNSFFDRNSSFTEFVLTPFACNTNSIPDRNKNSMSGIFEQLVRTTISTRQLTNRPLPARLRSSRVLKEARNAATAVALAALPDQSKVSIP